jgi:hypothetical protein
VKESGEISGNRVVLCERVGWGLWMGVVHGVWDMGYGVSSVKKWVIALFSIFGLGGR